MFPLNFVVGAAVGAVTTYVYKDDNAKQWLNETSEKLKNGVSSFMASFQKKAEDKAEDAAEAVVTVVEEKVGKAEEVQEAAAKA
ncbi:hypothetical protein J9253_15895 [Thiothrix litoralis]|jgi:uncharacterized membrane protein|uniref:YtxH-like protein n=1 Tax=Thiothrix litoralis TaxID=2891210 RepID=A0ABX7WTC4_9GAMM|nr:hypothetical protein [Thiothrix litoralis]QTR45473.1 hypothetical protein J9253_15895 [Thiothrix litoralis]